MTLTFGFVLLVLVAALTAFGQICFKKMALLEISFFRKFFQPIFLLGVALFVCGPVLSSLAAQVVDFSVMYGMTALNFVFVLVLSRLLLNEKIDWPKIGGVAMIVIGLLVMVSA